MLVPTMSRVIIQLYYLTGLRVAVLQARGCRVIGSVGLPRDHQDSNGPRICQGQLDGSYL